MPAVTDTGSRSGPSGTMSTGESTGTVFTGTGALLRLALRRDRVRIAVWLASLSLGTYVTAIALTEVYGTEADQRAAMLTMSSPAGLAFSGPAHYFTDYSLGPIISHQLLGFIAMLVGLMSVMFVVRHTRAEEEAGRAEVARASVVGRHAHLTAALLLTVLANLVLMVLLAVLLTLSGIETVDWPGSLLYGAAHAAAGLTFAGVAALTAQITQSSRGANGLGLAAVGAAYVIRAAGDAADNGLSWASPIGWVQQTFPYLDNRWWPLGLNVIAFLVLAALAMALSVRRDHGSGLRAPRRGRSTATRALRTPLGFTLRLHRGLLIGFATGLGVLGLSYGPFLGDVETEIGDLAIIEDAMESIGGEMLIDSFLTMLISIIGVVAAIYAVMATLRIRSEETSGRSEPVLGTWQSRTTFFGTNLSIALVGAPAVLMLSAVCLALTAQPTVDTPIFAKTLVAAAVQFPALWVFAGIAALLIGWAPRSTSLVWMLIAYAAVISYLGPILQLADWTSRFSPFGWVPGYPAEDISAVPLIGLTLVAVVLIVVGLVGFRRRDLNTG